MEASHQRTPTFSFSNAGPGIEEDDLLRAQRLLGGSSHGECYRQPWDAEPGLLRRPSYVPAPTMARYREEMMDMVRRSGAGPEDGVRVGGQEPVVCYELSLRDLVELPSAARALREGAAGQQQGGGAREVQASEKPDLTSGAFSEETGTATAGVKKEKKAGKLGGRKRDVFRGPQKLESGLFTLKMFFFLPSGVLGGGSSSRRQRGKEAARSKVTPAPKAIWSDVDKCYEDRSMDALSWEDCCHQATVKANRSSSGGGSEASSSSSSSTPSRRRRSFAGCYSFLHARAHRE